MPIASVVANSTVDLGLHRVVWTVRHKCKTDPRCVWRILKVQFSEWLESYTVVWQKCQKVLFKRGEERSHPCHMQKSKKSTARQQNRGSLKRAATQIHDLQWLTLSTCDKQGGVSCFSVLFHPLSEPQKSNRVNCPGFGFIQPQDNSEEMGHVGVGVECHHCSWELYFEAFYSTVMMFCAWLCFSKTASDVGETYWCPFPQ